MRKLFLILLLALAPQPASAQVKMPNGRQITHGSFVIGPDTLGVRPWTSFWLAQRLEGARLDSILQVWPYEGLLLTLLDTHEIEERPEPPPMGPSVGSESSDRSRYPWDLTRVMSEREQRELHRMTGLTSLVQVIVELRRTEYRLHVREVRGSWPRARFERYSVTASRLEEAAGILSSRMARDWERSVRSGTR